MYYYTCVLFENRVLRRIIGPRRDGVTGECCKLLNVELHDLYSTPIVLRVIKSRRMRWVGHVALMCERRSVYGVLMGKIEGKRPLGRPRRKWDDNTRIKTVVGCRGMDWFELAQDR
jgi:hypothetical protein